MNVRAFRAFVLEKIGVLFVCYGNICRSPMAEFVFKDLMEKKGVSDRFDIASAGTSGEHIGDSPDPRTVATLRNHGIACEGKRSRRLVQSDFIDYDYMVCMDRMNLMFIQRIRPSGRVCEICMMMDYADGGEVADPYYTLNFEKSYTDILKGSEGLYEHILSEHPELRRWG